MQIIPSPTTIFLDMEHMYILYVKINVSDFHLLKGINQKQIYQIIGSIHFITLFLFIYPWIVLVNIPPIMGPQLGSTGYLIGQHKE